jgi:signal peptidase I
MYFLLALVGVVIVVGTALDARRRGRSGARWAALVAATGPIGLVAYFWVRESTPHQGPLGVRRTVDTVLGALGASVLVAIVLSWMAGTIVAVATVEGPAMEPTLADGSVVVVSRLAYHWSEPRRGDVVMLYYPVNPDKRFVLRVIAEEGDLLRIVDGRVFVNDRLREDREVAPAWRAHDGWGPAMVPEGYLFVMGDRGRNSSDSRHWGWVPRKYITGRVALRLWGPGAVRFVR